MKVRMIGEVSGTRNGEDWPARGTVIDVPEEEARSLIYSGLAVDPTVPPAAPPRPVWGNDRPPDLP